MKRDCCEMAAEAILATGEKIAILLAKNQGYMGAYALRCFRARDDGIVISYGVSWELSSRRRNFASMLAWWARLEYRHTAKAEYFADSERGKNRVRHADISIITFLVAENK